MSPLSPPPKYGGDLFLNKVLHGETKFFEEVYRGVFNTGTNDQINEGEGSKSFTNPFSSNLNTVNLKIFFPLAVGGKLCVLSYRSCHNYGIWKSI